MSPDVSAQLVFDNTKTVYYLEKYGYVPPSNTGSLVVQGEKLSTEMKVALQKMQAFAGIKPTGIVDKETLELMERPRCGVKDRIRNRARGHRL